MGAANESFKASGAVLRKAPTGNLASKLAGKATYARKSQHWKETNSRTWSTRRSNHDPDNPRPAGKFSVLSDSDGGNSYMKVDRCDRKLSTKVICECGTPF